MRANLFWLNDEQWAKIKPLIPTNRPDRKPQNNRRILSGIIYVLKTGCRWQDCPPEYGRCASCHTIAISPFRSAKQGIKAYRAIRVGAGANRRPTINSGDRRRVPKE